MKDKKITDYYLLKKKSLSEADLFITDYSKTKRQQESIEKRVDFVEAELEVLKKRFTKVRLIKNKVSDDKK
tara:strand:+ start:880 stop:1092 length:213 start_codon:yes stop_codon:yes gene_type:complete